MRPTDWSQWLRDPVRATWLQDHPEDWEEAREAVQAFLNRCLWLARIKPSDEIGMPEAEAALWEGLQRYDARHGTVPITYLQHWVTGSLRNQANRTFPAGVRHPRGSVPAVVLSLDIPALDKDGHALDPWVDTFPAPPSDEPDPFGVDWEDWLARRPPHIARMARLLAQGHSQRDIARRLGYSQVTVSRVKAMIRDWITAYQTDGKDQQPARPTVHFSKAQRGS